MTSRLQAVVLSVLVAAAGCGAEGDAGSGDTTDLTRDLLAQPAGDGQSTPLAVDPSLAQEGPRVPVAAMGFNRGEEAALVKVVEMSDYGCGYCRQFHQESFPVILEEFIETGMVEWKFVPFITGMFDNSLVVTEAAECTAAQDPEAFLTLNARIWDEQSAWKRSDDPESVVHGWVEELGIDMAAFGSCLAEDDRMPRIAGATTLAGQLGVRGTPTFVVLGWPPLQGALPTEMFQQLLSAAHSQLEARQAEGAGAEGGSGDSGDAGNAPSE